MRIPLFIALLTATPALASAHTVFTSPTPRSPSDGLKTGPCGNVAATDTPTQFRTGETILVTWLETIEHPGYFRIAFSPGGDAGYDDNVLVDNIADVQCTSPPCAYETQVVLPSTPCEGCSLQLIQFMGTAEPYSPYFSCADITLVDGPLPDGGNGIDDGMDAGCCSTNRRLPAPAGLLLALLGVLVVRRRRFTRPGA